MRLVDLKRQPLSNHTRLVVAVFAWSSQNINAVDCPIGR